MFVKDVCMIFENFEMTWRVGTRLYRVLLDSKLFIRHTVLKVELIVLRMELPGLREKKGLIIFQGNRSLLLFSQA